MTHSRIFRVVFVGSLLGLCCTGFMPCLADEPERTIRAGQGPSFQIALSSDGKTAATGSYSGGTSVWDTETWSVRRKLKNSGYFRALSPDGEAAVTTNDDGFLEIWDTETGKATRTSITGPWHHHPPNAIWVVAFSPDGKLMAIGGQSTVVELYESVSLKKVFRIERLDSFPYSLAFSSDSNTLAMGTVTGRARLWDVAGRRELRNFMAHEKAVHAVAFAPDDTFLATGSSDGTVKTWDRETGQLKHASRVEGKAEVGLPVAFSPDRKTMAVGQSTGTVVLSKIATGEKLRELRWHRTPVRSVTFFPDGKSLITADSVGSIAVWRIDPEAAAEAGMK